MFSDSLIKVALKTLIQRKQSCHERYPMVHLLHTLMHIEKQQQQQHEQQLEQTKHENNKAR